MRPTKSWSYRRRPSLSWRANGFGAVRGRDAGFADSFLHWLGEEQGRLEMAANPTLLSLMCYLCQDKETMASFQPANRTELYEDALGQMLRDETRGRFTVSAATLRKFSCWLFEGGGRLPRRLFTGDDYDEFRRHTLGCQVSLAAEGWLKTKLIDRWNQRGSFYFTHLSFQEFLAAQHLFSLPMNQAAEIIRRYGFSVYWQEVFRFYAGLCRRASLQASRRAGALPPRRDEGEIRFRTLTDELMRHGHRDRFDHCLLWLAPLCREYDLADPHAWWNFDLREALRDFVFKKTHFLPGALTRAVGFEPEYYLDWSIGVIEQFLAADSSPPTGAECRLALLLIEAVHLPEAVEYQARLIQHDIRADVFRRAGLRVGPQWTSTRNQTLRERLLPLLDQLHDPKELVRLVDCLVLMPAKEVAVRLAALARSGAPPLRLSILRALAGMEADSTLELAGTLWAEGALRENRAFRTAVGCLARVATAAAALLLEDWLAQNQEPDRIVRLLEALAAIGLRSETLSIERLRDHTEAQVQRAAFALLCRRWKSESLRLNLREWLDLADAERCLYTIRLMAERGFDYPYEAILDLSRQARAAGREELWMACEALAVRRLPASPRRETVEARLENFTAALSADLFTRHLGAAGAWMETFAERNVGEHARRQMGEVLAAHADRLDEALRHGMLAFFGRFPAEAPVAFVAYLYQNGAASQRKAAAKILLLVHIAVRSDPGLPSPLTDQDPALAEVFETLAAENQVFFFHDGWMDRTGEWHLWPAPSASSPSI